MDAPVTPRLILASASPRRRSLLSEAGFEFVVHPSHLDERASEKPGLLPADLALHLAVAKADVVAERFSNDVILAADTVVAFGDTALGQPTDAQDAARMLRLLEGTTHMVITAVAVMRQAAGHQAVATVRSAVRMRPLSDEQISHYVARGDWRGKAGGYGIQDNDPFVERLTGCQTNIVGLPMTTTVQMLRDAGLSVRRNETK
jgi:septum formation protein